MKALKMVFTAAGSAGGTSIAIFKYFKLAAKWIAIAGGT
jgi:hypothetical protein